MAFHKPLSFFVELTDIVYEKNNLLILDHINWKIGSSEHWVLLGRNGAGKSSLINIIFGYHWPVSGDVKLFGETLGNFPVRELQKRIGILESSHQENRLQRNMSVYDVLVSGLLGTIGIYGEVSIQMQEITLQLIKENPWIKNPNEYFDKLSSGEKKKILLLRALINNPDLLILDEPCSSLDIHAREDFNNLLIQYKNKRQFSSILITHRTDEIPNFYEHVFLIANGKMISAGKRKDLMTDELISKVYEMDIEIKEQNGNYFMFPKRSN